MAAALATLFGLIMAPLLLTAGFRYLSDEPLVVGAGVVAVAVVCLLIPAYGRFIGAGVAVGAVVWFFFLAWLFNQFEGIERL